MQTKETKSASTEKILQSYKHFQSVRGVAKDTGYSWNRIVKALSTSGIILNKSHARILELYKSGKTISQIAKETNLSKRTVQCYLPRTRPIYGENQSENAKRIVKHRTKKGNTNTNTIGFWKNQNTKPLETLSTKAARVPGRQMSSAGRNKLASSAYLNPRPKCLSNPTKSVKH